MKTWATLLLLAAAATPAAASPTPIVTGPFVVDRLYEALSLGTTHIGDWLQYANAPCGPSKGALVQMQVSWTGACENGWLSGSGILSIGGRYGDRFANADVGITGSFRTGHLEGPAHVIFLTEPPASFDGEFHDGQPNGHGVLMDRGGMRIAGDYLYDRLKGRVVVDYPDGSRAELTVGDPPWANIDSLRFADGTQVRMHLPDAPSHTLAVYADGSMLETNYLAAHPDNWAIYCTPGGRRIEGAFEPAGVTAPAAFEYPGLSWRLHEEGMVELFAKVNRDGTHSGVIIHKSSRAVRLDNAALHGAESLRFTPPTVAGHAIAAPLILGVTYELQSVRVNINDVPITILPRDSRTEHWHIRNCRRP